MTKRLSPEMLKKLFIVKFDVYNIFRRVQFKRKDKN